MSDIEQALAEALHEWRKTQSLAGCGWKFRSVIDGKPYCPCPADADAILATEPMQAIARQAAIGAAVERLDRGDTNVTMSRWPNGKWTVITATVGSATGWGGPSDLRAAIAAALDPEAPTDE